jgi:hypothetical protein
MQWTTETPLGNVDRAEPSSLLSTTARVYPLDGNNLPGIVYVPQMLQATMCLRVTCPRSPGNDSIVPIDNMYAWFIISFFFLIYF